MNASLTDTMEEFVRQEVAAGDYETATEVVRKALRVLRKCNEFGKRAQHDQRAHGLDLRRTHRLVRGCKSGVMAFKKTRKSMPKQICGSRLFACSSR
jgi:putative addiction module CopG family antidote